MAVGNSVEKGLRATQAAGELNKIPGPVAAYARERNIYIRQSRRTEDADYYCVGAYCGLVAAASIYRGAETDDSGAGRHDPNKIPSNPRVWLPLLINVASKRGIIRPEEFSELEEIEEPFQVIGALEMLIIEHKRYDKRIGGRLLAGQVDS